MAITREQARELLEAVPDDRLDAAAAALEPLIDPMLVALMNAPEDDEPLTDEDLAVIAEGKADIERGDIVSAEDMKRRPAPTPSRRSRRGKPTSEDDPLWGIVGIADAADFPDVPADVSANKHRYLADAYDANR